MVQAVQGIGGQKFLERYGCIFCEGILCDLGDILFQNFQGQFPDFILIGNDLCQPGYLSKQWFLGSGTAVCCQFFF